MPAAWDEKIFILVPHQGTFPAEWMFGFLNLVRPPHTDIRLSRGMPLPEQRNQLVEQALEGGATHALFLDADIVPPPDGLAKLAQLGEPIVSGIYWTRQAMPTPSAWMERGDGAFAPIDQEQKGEVVQVDAVGMGFCLIDTEVFQRVEEPWFVWTARQNTLDGVSEDFYFCRKAREEGYRILVQLDVRCAHVGMMRLNEDGSVGTMKV